MSNRHNKERASRVAQFFCVLCLSAACGDRGEGPDSDGGAPPGDQTGAETFDVEWRDETTILTASQMEQAGARVDDEMLTVDVPGPEFAALAVDDLLVLEAAGVFRVAEVMTDDGSAFRLETASLLDAAQRGTIAWDMSPEPGTAVALPLPDADPEWQVETDPARKAKDTMSFAGTLGGTELKATVDYDGTIASLTFSAKVPSPIPYTVKGTANLKGLRIAGIYAFANGKVQTFRYQIRNFELTVDLTADGGGASFDQQLAIPVGLYFPLSLGLLPTYVGLGGEVNVRAAASGTDSGNVVGRIVLSGSSGVELEAEHPVHVGSVSDVSLTVPGSGFDIVNGSGFGATIDFPRVDFGVGAVGGLSKAAPRFSAGVYAKYKTEALENVKVSVVDDEKLWCNEKKASAGIYFGGQIKTFGVAFGREIPLWSRASAPDRVGPGCD